MTPDPGGAVPAARRGHPGWPARLGPVHLPVGEVVLRRLAGADGHDWRRERLDDRVNLEPWDASGVDWEARHTPGMWRLHRSALNRAARLGTALPFAITVNGRFAGQVSLGGIDGGPSGSAWIGYWVAAGLRGRKVAGTAAALLVGHAFGPVGLHRVEATMSVDNAASAAVVARLGFRVEGRLVRYLHVGGAWADHLLYAVTVEEVPGGTAELLSRIGVAPPSS